HEPHGSVFILRADLIAPEVRGALLAAARAMLVARNGTLAEQIVRRDRTADKRPSRARAAAAELPPAAGPEIPRPRPPLEFWNGLGGFADGGREYVTILGEGQ